MPRYSRRKNKNSMFNSTALVWGLAGFAVLLVLAFWVGHQYGYNRGFDAGEQAFQADQPSQEDLMAELLADLEEYDSPVDTRPEQPEEGLRITAEDLGISPQDVEVEESVKRQQDRGIQPTETPDDRAETPMAEPDDSPPEVQPEPEEELEEFHVIVVASSKNQENAQSQVENLENQGYPAALREVSVNQETWYRIVVGQFPNRSQADDFADEMVATGVINDYWINLVSD